MSCGTPRRWRDYGLPRHKQEESDAGLHPSSLVHRDTDSSRLHFGLSRRSLPYELPSKTPAGRQATPKPRAHSPARQIKNADGNSTQGKDLYRRSISSNSELRRHRFAWERGLRHSLNEPLLGARPSSKQDSAQHLPRSAQDSQQAALRPLPGPPAPNPQAEGPPREAAACAAEPPSRCRQLRDYRRYSTPAESLRTPQPKRLTGFGPSMRASLGEAQLSRSTCRPPGPAPRDSADRSAEEAEKGQSASRAAEAKGSACCPRGPRQRKPSNFDRSGTAGGEQCIARIGAVSHGGMSRGTWKRENQDVFYIQAEPGDAWAAGCVCDGHGPSGLHVSTAVSDVMAEHLQALDRAALSSPDDWEVILKGIFSTVDSELETRYAKVEKMNSGSCAIVVLLTQTAVVTSWVGDSKAVLGCESAARGAGAAAWKAKDLSWEHKPRDPKELKRIRASNGRVDRMVIDGAGTRAGPYRVYLKYDWQPGLATSRSFGDYMAKEVGVISTPSLSSYCLQAGDRFVVVGSDGVWEMLSSQEAVSIVGEFLSKNRDRPCMREASELVVTEAKQRWTALYGGLNCDDVTAVVMLLNSVGLRSVADGR